MDRDTVMRMRRLRARIDAACKSGEAIIEHHRMELANALLMTGICLTPSDHLQDHQFVVSQGVFNAAKKLTDGERKVGL
jgi:hypothetical protein